MTFLKSELFWTGYFVIELSSEIDCLTGFWEIIMHILTVQVSPHLDPADVNSLHLFSGVPGQLKESTAALGSQPNV